jgi:hypothetical protein
MIRLADPIATRDVGAAFADRRRIAIAMTLATIDALEECVRRKQTTPIWRDDRVVWVDAAPLLKAARRRLTRLRAAKGASRAKATRRRKRRAR